MVALNQNAVKSLLEQIEMLFTGFCSPVLYTSEKGHVTLKTLLHKMDRNIVVFGGRNVVLTVF